MNIYQRLFYPLLWGAVCFGYLAIGETFQLLPNFIINQFQTKSLLLGTVISIASLATALSRPIAGRLADNGYADYVILAGCLLSILGGMGHYYASSVPYLLIARLLLGAGEGALFTAAISLIMNHYLPEKRATYVGWFGLSMWSGLCIGPLLAVSMISYFGNTATVLGILTISLPLLSLLLILINFKNIQSTKQFKLLKNTAFLSLFPQGAKLPGFAFLLASFGYGVINTMLILYFANQHLAGGSIVLALFAIAFFMTRLISSTWIKHTNNIKLLMLFISIETVGLLMIAVPVSVIALLGIIFTGIGMSILYPAFVSIVIPRVQKTQQSTAIGFMTSFWDLGLVSAGPIGGFIALKIGFSQVFLTAALFSLISFFLIFKLKNK